MTQLKGSFLLVLATIFSGGFSFQAHADTETTWYASLTERMKNCAVCPRGDFNSVVIGDHKELVGNCYEESHPNLAVPVTFAIAKVEKGAVKNPTTIFVQSADANITSRTASKEMQIDGAFGEITSYLNQSGANVKTRLRAARDVPSALFSLQVVQFGPFNDLYYLCELTPKK